MGLSKREIYEKIARKELTPEEGLRLLRGSGGSPVEPAAAGAEAEVLAEEKGSAGKTSYLDALQRELKRLSAEISQLREAEFQNKKGFFEQGLESAHLMEIVKAIEKKMQVELYPTLLFEYTTIEELADYLVDEFGEKFPVAGEKLVAESGPVPETSQAGKKTIKEAKTARKKTRTKTESSASKPDRKAKSTAKKISPEKAQGQQVFGDLRQQDIAIIGLAGKYPGAENVEEFWEILKEGQDCVTEVPADRWDWREHYDPDPANAEAGKIYCKEGAFIKGVADFDPLFFGISPREAELMDPQERWFLQIAWHTIEDAGYTPERLGRDVGVFVGSTTNTYLLFGPDEWRKGNPVVPKSMPWSIANRVSYCMNFIGPSVPVDTACSSALTAVHYACQSLRNGECETAIAGGVNFYLHYSKYLLLCQNRMLSPNGRSFAFGENANGFGPGEGVGAILLKPLSQAENDNDHIYAVIKGSAVNHGGKASGYNVPSPVRQAEVIERALKAGNISADSISYIEAHGTGTDLGDPIEVQGLNKAFKLHTKQTQFCALGSAKSNIGHSESGAGIAGITKILLQMKHKQLVPSLHTEVLNPRIKFELTPFIVQRELGKWEQPEALLNGTKHLVARRAGISSFGAGGANSHIILEEYAGRSKTGLESTEAGLFLLSARTEKQLRFYIKLYLDFLTKHEVNLNNLLFTLRTGRVFFKHRLAVVCDSVKSLLEKLNGFLNSAGDSSFFYGFAGTDQPDAEPRKYTDIDQMGSAWVKGGELNWEGIEPPAGWKISLPQYPFIKKRYWFATAANNSLAAQERPHSFRLNNISTLKEQKYVLRFSEIHDSLVDYSINEEKYFFPFFLLELARAALAMATEQTIPVLSSVEWNSPVYLNRIQDIFINVYPEQAVQFEIYTIRDAGTQLHCRGLVDRQDGKNVKTNKVDISEIKQGCHRSIDGSELYEKLESANMKWGDGYKGILSLHYSEEKTLVSIDIPAGFFPGEDDLVIHPAIMAAIQQSLSFIENNQDSNCPVSFSPVSLETMTIPGKPPASVFSVLLTPRIGHNRENPDPVFDVLIVDPKENIFGSITGLIMAGNIPAELPGQRNANWDTNLKELVNKVTIGQLEPLEAAQLLEVFHE